MTHRLGVLDALRAFRAGSLSRAAYLDECRARAAEVEPRLRAFVHLPAGAGSGGADGPLSGIPVAVKDIIATADMPTENGSPIYAGHRPAEDAAVVAKLRSLGASVFGKTVTTEFAWRHPGPTVNPWNPRHTPGGSSSGSAAAVAAGIVPLALGTQTMGSVVRPAAFCGVVGLKPSFGALPTHGVHPFAPSLDTVGLLARSVDDAAYALSHCLDRTEHRDHSFSVAPESGVEPSAAPRLALLTTPQDERAEPAQRRLLAEVAARGRDAGARIEEIALPPVLGQVWDFAQTINAAEAAIHLGRYVADHPDATSEALKAMVAQGAAVPEEDYRRALENQCALREAFDSAFAGFDAVLTFPATGEAPEGLGWTGDAVFNMPWTFLGWPAVTLPAGFGPRGLPLGVQLVGGYRSDADLLRVAKRVEAWLGFERRWPLAG